MDNIKHVDGGSAEYWRERREAFALIREAEEAGERMKTAPLYLHGGYDEDGDVIPIENIEPFDDFEDAVQRVEANATAVSILVAQERMAIHDRTLWSVVAVLEALAARSTRRTARFGDRIPIDRDGRRSPAACHTCSRSCPR